MKLLVSIIAITVLGVFYVSGANADEPRASSQNGSSRYKEIIQRFDKNGDGRLSETERTIARKYFADRFSTHRERPSRSRSFSHRPSNHGRTHAYRIQKKPTCNCPCCKGRNRWQDAQRRNRRPRCGTGSVKSSIHYKG